MAGRAGSCRVLRTHVKENAPLPGLDAGWVESEPALVGDRGVPAVVGVGVDVALPERAGATPQIHRGHRVVRHQWKAGGLGGLFGPLVSIGRMSGNTTPWTTTTS